MLHVWVVQIKGFPLLQYEGGPQISQETVLDLCRHLYLPQIPLPPDNLPLPKELAHSPILLRF